MNLDWGLGSTEQETSRPPSPVRVTPKQGFYTPARILDALGLDWQPGTKLTFSRSGRALVIEPDQDADQ